MRHLVASCQVRAVVAAFLVTAGWLSSARAVDQTGDIEIVVADTSGARLEEVVLVLTGTGLPGFREGRTDGDGRFVFAAVPPGRYDVNLRRESYRGAVQEGIVLHAGRTISLHPVLSRGQFSEAVAVTAMPPLIDSIRTSSLHTFDRDFLDRALVGLASRNLTAPLETAPGVTAGADPRIRASGPMENVFLLDGADIGNPDPLGAVSTAGPVFEAIEVIQFQTGAMGAEYGRSTGGVANVITRSGGNTFSGSLDLRYSDRNLFGSGDHYDPDAIGYRRAFSEASVGGPVVQDRLWFFVALGDYHLQDAPAGSPETASGIGRSYLEKLTWKVDPAHKLSLLHSSSGQDVNNFNASSLTDYAALGHAESGSRLTSLEYVGLIGPRVIVQAQAALFDAGWEERPQSGDTTTRSSINFVTRRRTGNYSTVDSRDRGRREVSGSATWAVGKHTLKAGFDLQEVTTARSQVFNGGGWDEVVPDASGQTVPLIVYAITSFSIYENDARLSGFFVSDRWRLSDRWTANVGLRHDEHAYEDDVGAVVYETRLWQPRLGLAWDLTGDARNIMKGTWGRFGQPTNLNPSYYVNESHLAADVFANETVGGYLVDDGPVPLDINGDGVISERAPLGSFQTGGTTYAQSGRLDATFVDELSASYERRIGRASAFGITAVRRQTRNLIEDRYPDPEASHLVIENLPGLERTYSAVELRYEARLQRALIVASYTHSRNEGNLGLENSWGCSEEYDLPVLSENRWGYLPGDVRRALKVNGFWTLPRGFELGYAFQAHSGFPYTVLRTTLPYGDEYPEGRGSRRLPSFRQIDLEFRKSFSTGAAAVRLDVTVLNVLDSETVTAVNQWEGSLGEPLRFQRPRGLELGMHVSF